MIPELKKYRVLIAGLLSPFVARYGSKLVFGELTSHSANVDKDWQFRIAVTIGVIVTPFFVTLALAIRDRRAQRLTTAGRAGLVIAALSLGLLVIPVHGAMQRWRQEQNLAKRDVAAPGFDTVDIFGKRQRLADYRGQVVLVNIWATWCSVCRDEMPKLNEMYQQRKDKGFVVVGLSDEDVATQRKFLQQVPVIYPLLTISGDVPPLYREIVRYPAVFLIDRKGNLQPAPGPEEGLGKLQASVDQLLATGGRVQDGLAR